MHVFLTGAAGFIGSHVAEALCAKGHHVTAVDAFDDYLYPAEVKRKNAAQLAQTLKRKPFSLVEADICDQAMMMSILATPGIDVVCHLAALAGVRPSIAEPSRYIRTNLEGTVAILEAMHRHKLARMVFASSSSVYGAKGGQELAKVAAFSEDDLCLQPASPYAATKRAGELLGSTYRDLYGIGFSALRFFTVYGPRQRPDMAIHKFVKAVAQGKTLPVFGDGSTRRDYTFIDDIVQGVVAACERIVPGAYNIYNLGGTSTVSLSELVATIERVVGRKATLERLPMQPGDVPITFADITHAARDLGYAPKTRIEAGVEAFWQWVQRDRPA